MMPMITGAKSGALPARRLRPAGRKSRHCAPAFVRFTPQFRPSRADRPTRFIDGEPDSLEPRLIKAAVTSAIERLQSGAINDGIKVLQDRRRSRFVRLHLHPD